MAFLLRGYTLVLRRWPVTVQALQAGALMGAGDALAQTVVERKRFQEMSWKRTLQFASVGFLVVGPPLRVWYGVLDGIFGSSRTKALKKMAVDQLCFAPIFIVIVMSSIGLAQGQTVSEIRKRLGQDYKDILLTNYKVWPAVQLCNFYLVPLNYQVLSVQIVAVFWNTYLSWKSNTSLKMEQGVSDMRGRCWGEMMRRASLYLRDIILADKQITAFYFFIRKPTLIALLFYPLLVSSWFSLFVMMKGFPKCAFEDIKTLKYHFLQIWQYLTIVILLFLPYYSS